ncbi:MAG: hypothetical protein IT440_05185 [Phycisphaeraceae bacterium]|nr:hypothetical protein [Phycisphaeraceae bacterium]
MSGALVPLIFVAVVVAIIVAMVVSAAQARKRREALAQWANENGWSFSPANQHHYDARFPQFKCLAQGDNRYACNIVAGPHGDHRITVFDYHYETHSTDSKGRRQTHHHSFSAVLLELPLTLKPLMIRPENLLDKIAGAFGWDDIDFESAEFSRKFHVSSPDRRWAYDVLHPRAMQFLLDQRRYSIQFADQHVLIWNSSTFDVPAFQNALSIAEGLVEQLPAYVREQLAKMS